MSTTSDSPAGGSMSRRSFLSNSTAAAAGVAAVTTLAPERFAYGAAGTDTIKIALVGAGGRGRGAASQALSTGDNVQLVSIADVHEDNGRRALEEISGIHKEKVKVPADNQFFGDFQGYKKAISAADVVILATPPGFRPMQFEEAIRQGKHVFMEKPVAVDGPGVRMVLAAAEEAQKKKLKVGVGLQRRHQRGYLDTVAMIRDGAIGDLQSMRVYWNGATPWVKTREQLEKSAGRKLTEMEYQMRNWYYFVWLCGDHICEQHIHNLDVANWVVGSHPLRCWGMGGVASRIGKDYGEIFDHHAVEYEYANNVRVNSQCRHQVNTWNSVSEHALGTNGRADLGAYTISWNKGGKWRTQNRGKDPYQQEHDDLFNAIRNDLPYNEAFYGAESSLTAVMGRMATYTGKEITWEQALNSTVETMPKVLGFDAETLVKPREDGWYDHPIPGNPAWIKRCV